MNRHRAARRRAAQAVAAAALASGCLVAGGAVADGAPAGAGLLGGASAAAPASPAQPTPSPTTPAGVTPPVPSPAGTGHPRGGPMLDRPGLVVSRPAGVPPPPPLAAGAYLVADLDTGDVVLSLNAHLRARPASTIKTLTALTLVDRVAPGTQITAAPEDAAVDGTKVGMMPGSPYLASQLFQAMLMSSANDAATALARANGGVAVTAEQMTAKARSLGAIDTVARNSSGLDADGQLTTVYDMALLGRAAVRQPDIARYITTKRATFPAGPPPRGPRGTYEINNHNKLLYNYPGAIGVKNGYTVASRQTFIGAARRGSKAYVVTYLGGTDGSWRPTAALLDWAFANGARLRPVGTLDDPASTAGSGSGERSGAAGAIASALQDPPAAVSDAPRAVARVARDAAAGLASDPRVLGGAVAALAVAGLGLRSARRRARRARRR